MTLEKNRCTVHENMVSYTHNRTTINSEGTIMRAFVDLAEKLEQIVRDHDETLSCRERNDLMVAANFLRELWDASGAVDRYIGGLRTSQEEAAYKEGVQAGRDEMETGLVQVGSFLIQRWSP